MGEEGAEMNNTNTGGPAFPVLIDRRHYPDFDYETGMTLRDYFAAKAMQGLLAGKLKTTNMTVIAGECYAMADAMLRAREDA
jgi:hypothetical protein